MYCTIKTPFVLSLVKLFNWIRPAYILRYWSENGNPHQTNGILICPCSLTEASSSTEVNLGEEFQRQKLKSSKKKKRIVRNIFSLKSSENLNFHFFSLNPSFVIIVSICIYIYANIYVFICLWSRCYLKKTKKHSIKQTYHQIWVYFL